MTTQHCSELVVSDNMVFYQSHCKKPVKVIRDGKPYCTIHDPVRVEEKRKAQKARWHAEWAAADLVRHRKVVIESLCAEFDTGLLESHAAAIRKYIEGLS